MEKHLLCIHRNMPKAHKQHGSYLHAWALATHAVALRSQRGKLRVPSATPDCCKISLSLLRALCRAHTRLAARLPALPQRLHQQQAELAGARELGRAAEAAVPCVVAAGQRGRAGVDRGRRGPSAQLRALARLCSRDNGE